MPPSVPNRSADVFRELLHLLRGYPLHIRDEEHRATLLRDCRYFNFKGLEQKLIPHSISYNQSRGRNEIVLRVEDILKSGISVVNDPAAGASPGEPLTAWVNYMRPWEDTTPFELVLEIGSESTKLHMHSMRAEFFGQVKQRIARLFEVIATKLNLPQTTQPLGLLMAAGGAGSQPASPGNTPLSEDLVRIVIENDTHIMLDGKAHSYRGENDEIATAMSASSLAGDGERQDSPLSSAGGGYYFPPRKRRRTDMPPSGSAEEWVVRTGQWRLKIQGSRGSARGAVECVLVAVKLDAYSSELARNAQRGFLRG